MKLPGVGRCPRYSVCVSRSLRCCYPYASPIAVQRGAVPCGTHLRTVQWLADVVALCYGVCLALALDGWVARPATPPACPNTVNKGDAVTVSSGDASQVLLAGVAEACAEGLAPRALLAKCLRLLKPYEPSAPARLRAGGQLLEASHAV